MRMGGFTYRSIGKAERVLGYRTRYNFPEFFEALKRGDRSHYPYADLPRGASSELKLPWNLVPVLPKPIIAILKPCIRCMSGDNGKQGATASHHNLYSMFTSRTTLRLSAPKASSCPAASC